MRKQNVNPCCHVFARNRVAKFFPITDIGVGAGGDRGIDPPTYKSGGGIIPPLVRLNSVLNYSATFDFSTHAQCLCMTAVNWYVGVRLGRRRRARIGFLTQCPCMDIYSVSQKNTPDIFSCNLNKYFPIEIIFGTSIT